MKPTSGITSCLTRLAKIKDTSSARYQTAIVAFKATLRTNIRLCWHTPEENKKDNALIYKALGEVLEEGIIKELIFEEKYYSGKIGPDVGLCVLASYIEKSKLKNLTLINISYEYPLEEMAKFATNLPLTLETISLNAVTGDHLAAFFENLPPLKLRKIKITTAFRRYYGHNWYGKSDSPWAKPLAKNIEGSLLKELILNKNTLTLSALESLAPALEKSHVEVLNISDNEFEDERNGVNVNDLKRCQIIATILLRTKIRSCDLSSSIQTSQGFKHICDNLPNTSLRELKLNDMKINGKALCLEDIQHLANALPKSQLEYLSISANRLDIKSAQTIADKLPGSLIIQITSLGGFDDANNILHQAALINKGRRILANSLIKTILDPFLPRVVTDLIEGYVTDNPQLIVQQKIPQLQQWISKLPSESSRKYQQLQECDDKSSAIKKRKL